MKIIHFFLSIILATVTLSCDSGASQKGASQKNTPQNHSNQNNRFPSLNALRDSIDQEVYKKVKAIKVYHKDKVLVEEYYNGMGKDDIHDARSVGKSIASALLGIAIDEGYIKSLDQPLSDFYNLSTYENYDEEKGEITIRDLATMSSNFYGDDDNYDTPGNEEFMYDKENWVQWALNLPLDSTRNSGESWQYFTAGAVLIGDILNKSLPNGLEKYSKEKLFRPLGNTNYQWAFTPQDVPSTAGNFRTTATGFADFGKLYLNGGTWQNQRVISEKWVNESLSIQLKTKYDPNYYGYFWWIKDLEIDGNRYRTEYCSGNGGNHIYVIKELDAVIVILASAYNTRYGHRQSREITSEFLLPIILKEAKK